MRRWRIIVGPGVVAVVAVLAVAFWPLGPRPCRATFELVREGMTYDEVCATVGGPPGNYNHGPYGRDRIGMAGVQWVCDDCALFVTFADDGTARFVMVKSHLAPAEPPPLLERLRARFGL